MGTSFLQNVKFGVLGDSISSLFNNAWQNVVIQRTGMILTVQDARPGKSFATAFECWGQPAIGGQPGTFTPNYNYPNPIAGNCSGYQNTGLTDGETFAQSLANVDFQLVVLGTNDTGYALGQLGDATNAGTFYGNMRWVAETYLNAKPSLRLVFVTLQENGSAPTEVNQQYANATVAYCNSVGIPVINMYNLGGVNWITSATLTLDGTHPSPLGFAKFYGPVIAQGVQKFF
jgi:lysophospholipase L1-like esterase